MAEQIIKDKTGIMKDLVLTDEAPAQEAAVPSTYAKASTDTQEEMQAAPEPESIETQETTQPEPIEQPKPESHSQRNFKTLKAEAARLAKERDEAQALLRQYELEKKSRQLNVPVEEDDYDLENDSIAEGKHLKKIAREMKAMKQELERSRQESSRFATRAALIAEHPDYERIVTQENLTALELTYPHIAKSINMNDPYNAGKTCYELIKQFGISNDAEEAKKTEITKAMIKQNLAKPKVGVSVQGTKVAQQSPMGRASEFYEGPLTDEMKKVFYKEMLDDMNRGR